MATAAEIMTRAVITATPETPVWSAARVLLDRGHGGMPVVDAAGNLIGMVSGFDVISKTGETVGEIMSRGVVWAHPTDSLEDVIQLMGLHGIRRVPVCEGDQLVGIISRSDLLAYYTAAHERTST